MANYKRRSRRRDKANMLACGCCEDIRYKTKMLNATIEDGPCTGKKLSKRQPTPKKKCPVNGTHEWYTEQEIVRDYSDRGKPGYWNCEDCRWDRSGWYKHRYCATHLNRRFFTQVITTKTCIHCWTVKTKKGLVQWEDGKGTYPNPKARIKKRPLRF